jgi:hypothetical protein
MNQTKPDRGLWIESWDVLKRNELPALIYVGAILLLALLSELVAASTGFSVAQAIAAAYLAIPAHLTMLKGISGNAALANNKIIAPFFLRSIGLGLLTFIPALIAVFLFMASSLQTAIAAAAIAALLGGAAIFAKWGTMLPATAVEADNSFAAAGRRGAATFGYAFPRLLVAFGVLTALQFAIIFGLASMSRSDGNILPASGGIDAAIILGIAAGALIGAYQIAMTAVVLSRAYLMSGPERTI